MAEVGLRLALAGVLLVAAAAKLAAPAASREALVGFGFGSAAARQIGFWSLVAAELVLAGGVVAGVDGFAWLAAAFTGMLALAMAGAILRGRAGEPCGCFGSRSRIGWTGVARNVALTAGFAAVALLPEPDLSTDQWLGLGIIASLALCAALAAGLFALAREVGLLRLRVGPSSALEIAGEGPELGSRSELVDQIPGASGSDIAVAIFTSDSCRVCEALKPSIDSVAAHPAVALGRFDERVDGDAWASLDIPGSPYAVALDRDGTVLAKGTFNNLAQLESVLGAGERRRASMSGRIGG